MLDKMLVKKLKQKNEHTFEKVFNTYKNLVFYECNSVLENRSDAEEVTQEVFIEFFNKVDMLSENTNIKLHLSGLAKRRAIDLYRKKAKDLAYNEESIENFGYNDVYVDVISSLHGFLDNKECRILNLRVLHDYTFNEISLDLKMTIGEVQAIYYKVIKKLKTYYKERN